MINCTEMGMETEQEHEDGTLLKSLWFVVYRYVCVDDIIINFTTVVSIQTCLRFYLVLH